MRAASSAIRLSSARWDARTAPGGGKRPSRCTEPAQRPRRGPDGRFWCDAGFEPTHPEQAVKRKMHAGARKCLPVARSDPTGPGWYRHTCRVGPRPRRPRPTPSLCMSRGSSRRRTHSRRRGQRAPNRRRPGPSDVEVSGVGKGQDRWNREVDHDPEDRLHGVGACPRGFGSRRHRSTSGTKPTLHVSTRSPRPRGRHTWRRTRTGLASACGSGSGYG